MLNGSELIDRKIITGSILEENIAQHGIDLNVVEISTVGVGGFIPKEGKTVVAQSLTIQPISSQGKSVWALLPGCYNVMFAQGCKIPSDVMLLIRQRSSLLRNGTTLQSSVFDAGFETENIGTVMVVHQPITIEVGARIAQIYNHSCTPVENLYNGQFQRDVQRM